MKKAVLLISLSIGMACTAYGQNLLEIYQLAEKHDASFQAARATYAAQKEVVPIARGLLLPSLDLSANTTYNNVSTVNPRSFNSNGYSLTATQVVFDWSAWKTFNQAQAQLKQAVITFAQAQQSLVINTASAYFNVLEAADQLRYAKKNMAWNKEQMAQAEQKFKVGLAAQTDVLTAQASYEAAVASYVAAKNTLNDQYEALDVITGVPITHLTPLKNNFPLIQPSPLDPKAWVNTTMQMNLDIQAAKALAKFDQEDIGVQKAGYFPTVKLTGTYGVDKTSEPGSTHRTQSTTGAVNLTYNLFQGGATYYNVKKAKMTYHSDQFSVQQAERQANSDIQSAYLTVLSDISQVKALRQAVISGESSVKAARAAYLVGTRTIVDLLQEQSSLFATQQNYATSIYNYINASLNMKKVAGLLTSKDIAAVNKWLNNTSTKKDKKPVFKKTQA